MRLPLSWLNDLFTQPLTDVDAIARALTLAGLEVESIDREAPGFEHVKTGRIVVTDPHPNADRLRVCQTDFGTGELLQIVTGASNVKAGDIVPVALVGAKLPNGLEIKASKLRGVDSNGMYCSLKELGMEGGVDGVQVLPPDTPLGVPAANVLGVGEVVIDVSVLANRPDALSVRGIARELASAGLGTLKPLEVPKLATEGDRPVAVTLDASDLCPRYAGLVVEGITVGESPAWVKQRLEACGVRSISNVVDVTNYVMLELGQPMHAFDRARIDATTLTARRAKAGERIVTLDGQERELDGEMLVIADGKAAHAIAGVMGGADSQVTAGTTAVVLEAAYFEPKSVRRTAKKLSLGSESSYRFERGVDPEGTLVAMARAAQLLAEVAGGKVVGAVADARVSPDFPQPLSITVRPARVSRVLGAELPLDEARTRLEAIGFVFEGDWKVRVPGWRRHDVTREIDVIEEIVRLLGYDRIPDTLMPLDGVGDLGRRERVERKVRAALVGSGLDEVVTSSLVSEASLSLAGIPAQGLVKLANPLAEMAHLRPSMLPGLLEVARFNHYQGQSNLALFELGRTYEATGPDTVNEARCAAFLLVGEQAQGVWKRAPEVLLADFFWAKGIVERLAESMGIAGIEAEAIADDPSLHPGRTARLRVGDRILGVVAEVHPAVYRAFDLPHGLRAAYACLSLDAIEALAPSSAVEFASFSRFPAVMRDLALVVSEDVPAAVVVATVRAEGGPLLESVDVFDRYQGPQVAAGKVSLGLRLKYRQAEGTLSDEVVEPLHQKIVSRVGQAYGAELRD